jgi:hypothetical protein
MRYFISVVVVAALTTCTHPQNPERRSSLDDQVTGALQPTDRVFLKDDPMARVACRADAQCPMGALCHPQRNVCFTAFPPPQMVKLDVTCPLVPLYFAFDSTVLVPEARDWIDRDAECLKVRRARTVVLTGFADEIGPADYNVDLSRRRAEVVRAALAGRGVTVDVSVKAMGEKEPLLKGENAHDYAYNRRVELESR